MRRIRFINGEDDFPATSNALEDPNGLLAAGGELTPELLLAAYRRGIFPWYEEPQPVLWWTPNPRSVLFPPELHVSRSLRKVLRQEDFLLAVDCRFTRVMQACAAPRRDERGTWIGEEMLRAYRRVHTTGLAHSIEVLDRDNRLVGGLYGVALGRIFFGESMFSRVSDSSKVAMVALVNILQRGGFTVIDCQVASAHLNSLGARDITRLDFEGLLDQTIESETDPGIWSLPATCGGLM